MARQMAVAQAENILVGYLPVLAMRRIADLHPGEAKTARDAAISRVLVQTGQPCFSHTQYDVSHHREKMTQGLPRKSSIKSGLLTKCALQLGERSQIILRTSLVPVLSLALEIVAFPGQSGRHIGDCPEAVTPLYR